MHNVNQPNLAGVIFNFYIYLITSDGHGRMYPRMGGWDLSEQGALIWTGKKSASTEENIAEGLSRTQP